MNPRTNADALDFLQHAMNFVRQQVGTSEAEQILCDAWDRVLAEMERPKSLAERFEDAAISQHNGWLAAREA